ncbi:winged helix-turn-helix transcriptional regulator [Pseudomonas corrugata]|uniref:winged helix-turn-helix transcriptional regulator n=1 Tax=Pseudomonas corrugata TaxID=47879 RepID=UPI00387803D4
MNIASTYLLVSVVECSRDIRTAFRSSMEAVVDLTGGKWKLLILDHLCHATVSFGESQQLVGNVSERMPSQQLSTMAHDRLRRSLFSMT